MVNDETVEKFGADKIFLLGLFALSLLLGRLLVTSRTAIKLTDPIYIEGIGISVRLPEGNGWSSGKNWRHEENTFFIGSAFNPDGRGNSALVKCTYRLASKRTTAEEWLSEFSATLGTTITDKGIIESGINGFHWAGVEDLNNGITAVIGTVELPYGRWVDIEVTEMSGTEGQAKSVLERVVSTLDFEDNDLLGEGIGLVKRVKNVGLDRSYIGDDQLRLYIIENSARQDIGFMIEGRLQSDNVDEAEFQAIDFLYLKMPGLSETAGMFRCSNNISEFHWESRTKKSAAANKRSRWQKFIPANLRQSHEENIVTLSDSNTLSVVRSSDGVSKLGHVNKAAVADAAAEAVYGLMAAGRKDKAIIDVILSDGRVRPVVVSVLDGPFDDGKTAYGVEAKYAGSDESEQVFFDNRMRVIKRVIRQNGIYILERATVDEVIQRFPERAEFISQRSESIIENEL